MWPIDDLGNPCLPDTGARSEFVKVNEDNGS